MKITEKNSAEVTFGSIGVGTPFKWNGQYLLKIEKMKYMLESGRWSLEKNMISLTDCGYGYLADCELVIPYSSCELS